MKGKGAPSSALARTAPTSPFKDSQITGALEESDGWRHMLLKLTVDLNAARDEISHKEVLAVQTANEHHAQVNLLKKEHAEELHRLKQELTTAAAQRENHFALAAKAHAEELQRLQKEHAAAIAVRDNQVARAWQDAQAARDGAGQAEGQLHVTREELLRERNLAAQELRNISTDHAHAVAVRDAEIDRLQKELQYERREAERKQTEAQSDTTKEVSKLRETHTEELRNISQGHTHVIALRDVEIERLRKELQYQKKETERKQAEAEQLWQQRLAEVEKTLRTVRADFQQEREHMLKAQGDAERALATLREGHADELTKALTRQGEELEQRDNEIERLKRELREEREEGERACLRVDEAWRQRLAGAEEDLAAATAELQEERRLAEELGSEGKATASELREQHAKEVSRREKEQEKAARIQVEASLRIQQLEEAQEEERSKQSGDLARALQLRDVEMEAVKKEVRAEREEVAMQEHEAQEAWRWLSRVERDLNSAQKEAKQERERATRVEAEADKRLEKLRKVMEGAASKATEAESALTRRLQKAEAHRAAGIELATKLAIQNKKLRIELAEEVMAAANSGTTDMAAAAARAEELLSTEASPALEGV